MSLIQDRAFNSRLLAAIGQKESGGDYKAFNPSYSATGKYQFIPETARGLGWSGSIEELKANPQAQDNLAWKYLSQLQSNLSPQALQDPDLYVQEIGRGWFGGPGAMQRTGVADSALGGYTTGEYGQDLLKIYKGLSGGQIANLQPQSSSVQQPQQPQVATLQSQDSDPFTSYFNDYMSSFDDRLNKITGRFLDQPTSSILTTNSGQTQSTPQAQQQVLENAERKRRAFAFRSSQYGGGIMENEVDVGHWDGSKDAYDMFFRLNESSDESPNNTRVPIVSPYDTDALVEFAGWGDYAGNHAVLVPIINGEPNRDFAHKVAINHLENLNVKSGQIIKPWDVIGIQGETGARVKGAHVDFRGAKSYADKFLQKNQWGSFGSPHPIQSQSPAQTQINQIQQLPPPEKVRPKSNPFAGTSLDSANVRYLAGQTEEADWRKQIERDMLRARVLR